MTRGGVAGCAAPAYDDRAMSTRHATIGPAPAAALAGPAVALAPGDRTPNFVLPDATGQYRMFYERTRGRPTALVLDPGPTSPAAGSAVAVLEAAADAFHSAGIDVIVVTLGPARDGPFLVLGDPQRAITRGLRQAAGLTQETQPAALLLDPNQRLIATAEGAEAVSPEAVLAVFAARPPAPAGVLRSATAPVLVMPDLIDRAMCRGLIELWETSGHDEGTVGSVVGDAEESRVYHAMKKRRDHRIMDGDLNRTLQRLIGRRVAPELEKAFQFTGFAFDRFLVVCYDSARGDYFRPHRDNLAPSCADRRFAMTLNLNSDAYEGGELTFPEYGPDGYKPGPGGAVIFSCSLIHEARPVTSGVRFALLTFLRDPPGGRPRGSAPEPARPG